MTKSAAARRLALALKPVAPVTAARRPRRRRPPVPPPPCARRPRPRSLRRPCRSRVLVAVPPMVKLAAEEEQGRAGLGMTPSTGIGRRRRGVLVVRE